MKTVCHFEWEESDDTYKKKHEQKTSWKEENSSLITKLIIKQL